MSDWFTVDGESVSGLPDPGTTNRLSTLEREGGFYRPNFRSFGRFIRSQQVRRPVIRVAHDIARRAGEYAPKSETTKGGGNDGSLSESYDVRSEAGEMKVDGHFRVKVEVFNSDSAAAPIEFGNSHLGKPGRRPLARAGNDYGDFKTGASA